MSGRVHAEAKAAPKSSFTPVQSKLFVGFSGKQLVSQLPLVQTKLTINQPNDRYEQEADRVADVVMRMPEPRLQRQVEPEEEEETLQTKPLASEITPLVQRQVELEGGEEEELIQAKDASGQTLHVSPIVQTQIHSLRGGGQRLSSSLRNFFEPRFGHDFSQVRVHTDAKAAESARAVNARAFTIGRDVVFGAGEYSSESLAERKLLAHELTHVLQQIYSSGQSARHVGSVADAYERESDAVVMSDHSLSPVVKAKLGAGFVQRQIDETFGLNELTDDESTATESEDGLEVEVQDGDSPISGGELVGEISEAELSANELEADEMALASTEFDDILSVVSEVQFTRKSKKSAPKSKPAGKKKKTKARPTILLVIVDLTVQGMTLYWSNGTVTGTGPKKISSGKGLRKGFKGGNSATDPCKNPNQNNSNCTPIGIFIPGIKGGVGYKNKKGDAMSWFVELRGPGAYNRGIGIHDKQPVTGKPASHGCIRVDDPTAKTINKNITKWTLINIIGTAPIKTKKKKRK